MIWRLRTVWIADESLWHVNAYFEANANPHKMMGALEKAFADCVRTGKSQRLTFDGLSVFLATPAQRDEGQASGLYPAGGREKVALGIPWIVKVTIPYILEMEGDQ